MAPLDATPDHDPIETNEWVDALKGVLAASGPAVPLPDRAADRRRREEGAYSPFRRTPTTSTRIPVDLQPKMPGDFAIEEKIRNYARWNAMAMVVRANKHTNVGGHIASYASAAVLYDVGFNHFWHVPSGEHGGDLVFIQGHRRRASTPARSCWAGSPPSSSTLPAGGRRQGHLVVPAPWLMPTSGSSHVSMGLGPLMRSTRRAS